MKAAVYYGVRDIRVEEQPVPAIEGDDILLEVEACAICGTDVRTFLNGSSTVTPPRVLGHEVCGIVREISAGMNDGPRVGDRVIVAPAVGCGYCRDCQSGAPNMCERLRTLGLDCDGGFAEYMVVPARARFNLIKVPEGLAPEHATLAEPLACCINGQDQVGIRLGDSVVVIGAGPIGCMHTLLARLRGALKVVVIDKVRDRLGVAKELGATEVLCSESDEPVSSVLEITGGAGADVVIVACPSSEAQGQALQMCARRGRVLLFGGLPPGKTASLDTNLIHYKQIHVTGSHASTVLQNRLSVQLLASRVIPSEKLLTRVEPLDRIREAFDAAVSATEMKIAVKLH
ncbi:MAG TPA: alcohol dehydrogenase catalytic domain-containing protein [Firmicutes bacterium]|nr:alcohol dehydrogenase catalytic domain-containing protein [Bacillota bacterium]